MTTPLANTPAPPPRRRARRAAKWGLLAASVLVAGVFVASLRWGVAATYCRGDRDEARAYCVEVNRGGILFLGSLPVMFEMRPRLHMYAQRSVPGGLTRYAPEPASWPRWGPNGGVTLGFLPLWLPFTIFTLPAATLFHRDRRLARRRRAGMCVKCGYDRRGLAPGAICPECGAPAASAAAEALSRD